MAPSPQTVINLMSQINITFPDGGVKQFESGVTPLAIAESLSPQLARDVLAATVNDKEWDLTRPVTEDATLRLFKWDDPKASTPSGTHRPTCSPRLSRSSTQA